MIPQKIIVTGGSGFVGQWLIKELHTADPSALLFGWDRVLGQEQRGVPNAVIDITNPDNYREPLGQIQPDWIIHLAAISSVPYSLTHPEETKRVNVEAVQLLLETIEHVSPQTKVLVISSADMYGQGSAMPLPELPLSDAHPKNPYAASKWYMEQLIEQRFNDRVIRVRPFPHIGPGQQKGFVTADFASQIAAIESGKQKTVINVGNLEALRDFTDVRDVVRAYRLLIEKGQVGEVYHVASGQAVKIKTVLEMLLSFSTIPIEVQVDPTRTRASDTSIVVGDATKLTETTG